MERGDPATALATFERAATVAEKWVDGGAPVRVTIAQGTARSLLELRRPQDALDVLADVRAVATEDSRVGLNPRQEDAIARVVAEAESMLRDLTATLSPP